jgi:hypothetical protein
MDVNFQEVSKKIISEQLGCKPEEVYCVWSCKTLQHIKGLFSSDVEAAKGKYWEMTYNGIKNEIYIDRYVKEENTAIQIKL